MLWKEKERSRIRAVQMDNSEAPKLLGRWIEFRIERSDEGGRRKTDEGVPRWLSHVERMENDRTVKRV